MLSNFEIGVDEVGRGPLAGPVTVAAVLIPKNFNFGELIYKNKKISLRDSKKHTEKQREDWFEYAKQKDISFIVSSVYPKTIDKINISKAVNLAAERCIKKIFLSHSLNKDEVDVLTDGGIRIGNKKSFIEYESIIKGDTKISSIKMASIIAKVSRDRAMNRYDKEFPEYNFSKHKGYGTKEHMNLLKFHGPCRIHRLTFI
ncbi:MAG: ribonuclease HII [Candidatus Paceibacterota bacterium]